MEILPRYKSGLVPILSLVETAPNRLSDQCPRDVTRSWYCSFRSEDDKYGRRERGHSGPLSEFREKAGFRPSVKLEYVDDDGRALCPKEAFRYLSHKFHGKGPGKNKQEKRIKKAVQEGLMKKMSSTDTPLGTLQMLQDKQRETHSAYIVLSGNKRDQPT